MPMISDAAGISSILGGEDVKIDDVRNGRDAVLERATRELAGAPAESIYDIQEIYTWLNSVALQHDEQDHRGELTSAIGGQHHPKPRLAAHHSRVRVSRTLEWKSLYRWTNVGEHAEIHGVFRVGGRSG